MLTVEISNHPTTGLSRKVENRRLIISEHERYVLLELEVLHYDGDKIVLPTQQMTLKATDDFKVNSSGEVVPADSEEAVMTEFEYYMDVAENEEAKVNDLRRQAILKADKSGKFNL